MSVSSFAYHLLSLLPYPPLHIPAQPYTFTPKAHRSASVYLYHDGIYRLPFVFMQNSRL